MAGRAGPAGDPGISGMQGASGPPGHQGPVGIVDRWTSYRDFNFDRGRSELQASDADTVAEIASYSAHNPSLRIGIDGSMDAGNPRLAERRVSAVRDALMRAGVPTDKMETGAFGDPQLRRDGRVEVLLLSAR
jgi:outer membrane protein OmpA-like peptidoglycan-associated protein